MLFNSVEFFIFFPIVTIVYFLIPHSFRWVWLLAASCFFYMFFIPWYIIILFALILLDFTAAILIERTTGGKRRVCLLASIVSTCLVLFVFKYFNFFTDNILRVAELMHWNYPVHLLKLALPIGLSFHTFQSLSYVIEVYRGRQKAETHLGIYALYVMFYPQLVAGPIERPHHLLHQFYKKHRFEPDRVIDGLKLMVWGLFKKVVIADRLAISVNEVFAHPAEFPGITLLIGMVFFYYQIYCDFSGYSDIAIGTAKVMGFNLMKNFNLPYHAETVADFWKRWHISLTSWFRDYIYIPLARKSKRALGRNVALIISLLLSGFWHGANWTFITWGGLIAVYFIFGNITRGLRQRLAETAGITKLPYLHRSLRIATTFTLLCFTGIFFRSPNFSGAITYLSRIPYGWSSLSHVNIFHQLNQSPFEFGTAVVLIIFLEVLQIRHKNDFSPLAFPGKPVLYRWAFYYAFVLSIVFFGIYTHNQFIYFQF